MTKEVNEIKSQIGTLEKKLRDARDRLKAAELVSAGLIIGQVVMKQTNLGKDVCLAVITGWEYPKPTAVKVKKDGTAGSHSAGYMGNWRTLTAEEIEATQ